MFEAISWHTRQQKLKSPVDAEVQPVAIPAAAEVASMLSTAQDADVVERVMQRFEATEASRQQQNAVFFDRVLDVVTVESLEKLKKIQKLKQDLSAAEARLQKKDDKLKSCRKKLASAVEEGQRHKRARFFLHDFSLSSFF